MKNGVYPILSREKSRSKSSREPTRPRAVSPDQTANLEKSESPETNEVEQRTIISMECQIDKGTDGAACMTLTLKLEDKMNRQLNTELADGDTAVAMAEELVKYGLVNETDKEKLSTLIEEEQKSYDVKLAAETIDTSVAIEPPPLQQPITA